jgi:hypothetical protein
VILVTEVGVEHGVLDVGDQGGPACIPERSAPACETPIILA